MKQRLAKKIHKTRLQYQVSFKASDKFSNRMKIAIFHMLLLFASISMALICSSPIQSSYETITDQYSFAEYQSTSTKEVVAGPISGDLYFTYLIKILWVFTSPWNAAIRRVNASNTCIWMTSFSAYPISKTLNINFDETKVYIASSTDPLVVLNIMTGSGVISSQQQFSNINGNSFIGVILCADNSGYFIFATDNILITKVCKYTFLSSNTQCQVIPNIKYGWGHLLISSSKIFILGIYPTSSNDLFMFKFTFLSTSVDWANKIACSTTYCFALNSQSLLSTDSTTIYSFFIYKQPTSFKLYFAAQDALNGSIVLTRFRSSESILYVENSVLYGDYAIIVTSNPSLLVIYSISSNSFMVKSAIGILFQGIGIEQASGRLILIGGNGVNGYTTKISINSNFYHPDFSTSTCTMDALTAGTDDITSISRVTINTPDSSFYPSAGSFVNQSATYVQGPSSNVYFQITTQSISIFEGNTQQFTPDLSCLISGSNSITHSIQSSPTNLSWISIDSVTGALNIIAPNVNMDTEFDFYVSSTISGILNPAQKLIKVTVISCQIQFCQKCSNLSTCEICEGGYSLNSNTCIIRTSNNQNFKNEVSNTAKNQIIISFSINGLIAVTSTLTSFSGVTSLASFWSIINQIQMLNLFLLLRSFIPEDVKCVIKGKIPTINIYSYIPLSNTKFLNSMFSKFNFPLTNLQLDDLGINNGSSVYNIYPILTCIILLIPLHICLHFTNKLVLRVKEEGCCKCIVKILKRVVSKLYNIMTFGFYIRNCLEMSQFILVFSMSEVYEFDTHDIFHIISTIFSIILLFYYCLFICITLYLSFSAYKISKETHNKLGEFFCGIKSLKVAKLFSVIVLIRKGLYVAFLICLAHGSPKIVIGVISVIQLIYTIYLIYLRPFEEKKANLIEILNEVYFFALIFTLLFLSEEQNWSSLITSVYTWVLSSNSMIVLIIISIDVGRSILIWLCRKCTKSPNIISQPLAVAPKESIQSKITARAENSINNQIPNINCGPNMNYLREESKIDKSDNNFDINRDENIDSNDANHYRAVLKRLRKYKR